MRCVLLLTALLVLVPAAPRAPDAAAEGGAAEGLHVRVYGRGVPTKGRPGAWRVCPGASHTVHRPQKPGGTPCSSKVLGSFSQSSQ